MIIPFEMKTTTLVFTAILGASPLSLVAHKESNVTISAESAKLCHIVGESVSLSKEASLLDNKRKDKSRLSKVSHLSTDSLQVLSLGDKIHTWRKQLQTKISDEPLK